MVREIYISRNSLYSVVNFTLQVVASSSSSNILYYFTCTCNMKHYLYCEGCPHMGCDKRESHISHHCTWNIWGGINSTLMDVSDECSRPEVKYLPSDCKSRGPWCFDPFGVKDSESGDEYICPLLLIHLSGTRPPVRLRIQQLLGLILLVLKLMWEEVIWMRIERDKTDKQVITLFIVVAARKANVMYTFVISACPVSMVMAKPLLIKGNDMIIWYWKFSV